MKHCLPLHVFIKPTLDQMSDQCHVTGRQGRVLANFLCSSLSWALLYSLQVWACESGLLYQSIKLGAKNFGPVIIILLPSLSLSLRISVLAKNSSLVIFNLTKKPGLLLDCDQARAVGPMRARPVQHTQVSSTEKTSAASGFSVVNRGEGEIN